MSYVTMMGTGDAAGFTPDERILSQLSEHSFLSLWTHSNLFRDQGKTAATGDGKEIVDLAVILDDTLILFSDKRCDNPGPFDAVRWKRFVRRTLIKSIQQLEGAERWFRECPGRIFRDRSCTQTLDILPKNSFSRVLLVAICHGFENDVTDRLLRIDPAILDDWQASHDYSERCIGNYRTQGQFVHIFNGESLIVALRHFDTVNDFVRYLAFRAVGLERLSSGVVTERDLVALYYNSYASLGSTDIEIGLRQDWKGERSYQSFVTSPQYQAKAREDEKSYLIDALAEAFIHYYKAGTSITTSKSLSDFERGIRELAKLTRLERRMLADGILTFRSRVGAKRGTRWLYRFVGDSTATLLLCVPMVPGKTIDEYRTLRRQLMEDYLIIEKAQNPNLKHAFAIGMLSGGEVRDYNKYIDEGQDFCYIEYPTTNPELQQMLDGGEELRRVFVKSGMMGTKTQIDGTASEFPKDRFRAPPSSIRIPNNERNKPCPCGSGKKFKKCCLSQARIPG